MEPKPPASLPVVRMGGSGRAIANRSAIQLGQPSRSAGSDQAGSRAVAGIQPRSAQSDGLPILLPYGAMCL